LSTNINYIGFMLLVFLSVALFVGSVFFLLRRRNVVAERLAEVMPNKRTLGQQKTRLLQDTPSGIIDKVGTTIHGLTPGMDLASEKRLRMRLIHAGLRSKQAYANFIAAKIILALLLGGGYLLHDAFYQLSPKTAGIALFCALVGFMLPNYLILYLASQRQLRLQRGLPDTIDMMVVCVTAGLGLDMTIKRVAEEMQKMHKELSNEFLLTNLEVRAGRPREESYKEMAVRTGVADIHNLMTVLLQTSRFGTSVAEALRIHSDAMRVKRRQLAEELAAKAAVKLLIPLVFFIFPAFFVVLLGPAVIRVIRTLVPALG
ncbi:MAG: type II secretion system F family protein, partial [Desulfobulbaceae bacterium]|nr:type II secretion system F family protein [Desulfobulbaceae bacterium]